MVYVRYQIALSKPSEALRVLQAHSSWSKRCGFRGSLLTNAILTSKVLRDLGNHSSSIESVRDAISYAQNELYIRRFVDEDLGIDSYLSKLDPTQRGFAMRISRASKGSQTIGTSARTSHSESLSRRELEILILIVEGLSNQEIADRSYIALSTVKTHINNIYAKYGINSRSQAIHKARVLGIV